MRENHNRRLNINLDVLITEPPAEYHAKAGYPKYLSSHQLIDFMVCPKLYHKKQLGLVEDKQSDAMLFGSAVHSRILEGKDAFESAFAVSPYSDRRTKQYKLWAEQMSKCGKELLSQSDGSLIESLACGVSTNSEAVDLILYGRAEGVVRANYCDIDCQIRIDWLHPHRGIVDLKTCNNLDQFEWTAQRFRYHNQLAFYQAVLAQVIGEHVPAYIIAVEKVEPFRCGLWRISDSTLAQARYENEAAINRLKLAWQNDEFPTGYEEIRILDFPNTS